LHNEWSKEKWNTALQQQKNNETHRRRINLCTNTYNKVAWSIIKVK
jgi:cation transport regulator ChaB